MKREKVYVVVDEFEGAYVGTADEILEWAHEKQININECEANELGAEVYTILSFKRKGE